MQKIQASIEIQFELMRRHEENLHLDQVTPSHYLFNVLIKELADEIRWSQNEAAQYSEKQIDLETLERLTEFYRQARFLIDQLAAIARGYQFDLQKIKKEEPDYPPVPAIKDKLDEYDIANKLSDLYTMLQIAWKKSSIEAKHNPALERLFSESYILDGF